MNLLLVSCLVTFCLVLDYDCFLMWVTKSFIVLCFIFKSMNHFELIFVKSVSPRSRFTFLLMDAQHHLFKKPYFSIEFLLYLSKHQLC